MSAATDPRPPPGRPLAGRRVVVTRAAEQAATLVEHLRAAGAEVVAVPTIEVVDPTDGGEALRAAAAGLGRYDWVAFSSANAVRRLLACLPAGGAARLPRTAAVGPGTAAALRAAGAGVDLEATTSRAEGLAAAFPSGPGSVLLPQAAAARPTLAAGLAAKGWEVHAVEAYRTVGARVTPEQAAAAAAADAIAFTSGSTVAGFVDAAGRDAVPPTVACIGPVTAGEAVARGVAVTVVAGEPTVPALVAALVRALGTIGP